MGPSAALQVPTVRMVNVEYPAYAAVGSVFGVNLTFSYAFDIWILVDIGIQDAANATMLQSRRVVLDKPEVRSYALQLTAPRDPREWKLLASARCWCATTWIQHPTQGNRSFAVQVVEKTITVDLEFPTLPLQVRFDNETHQVMNGRLRVETLPGSHFLAAPPYVYVAENERWVFDSWSNNFTAPSMSVIASSDVQLSAKYVRQFRVSTHANSGRTIGSGWYDEGSTATLTALPPPATQDWLFQDTPKFVGWTGSVTSTVPTISLLVDSPKLLVAEWTRDSPEGYALPVLVLGSVTLALTLMFQVTSFKRRRSQRTADKASRLMPPNRFGRKPAMLLFLVIVMNAASLSSLPHAQGNEDIISTRDSEWYYWHGVPTDTCIIWMSGGLVFPDHQKINPYFLESYNTMQFVQALTTQYCVVALRSGADNFLQANANRTIHTQSYYSGSTFIGELHKSLKNRGYSYVFLVGFSIGGVIAAHEVTVRNPNLWASPDGVILISAPLSSTVISMAGQLKSNLLLMYGSTMPPVFIESGRSYFERAPAGKSGERWQSKEFHILSNFDHEVWTRIDNGNYDDTAFQIVVAFIERSKSLPFTERIQSSLPPCKDEEISITSITAPERVPLRTVYNIWLKMRRTISAGSDIAVIDVDQGILRAVQTLRANSTGNVVKLTLTENRTFPQRILLGIVAARGEGEFCKAPRTVSLEARNPIVTVGLPLNDVPIWLDGKTSSSPSEGGGYLQFEVPPGIHTLEAPRLIGLGNDTRAVFRGWSDGQTEPSRTLLVVEDIRIDAVYSIQYHVVVSAETSANPRGRWVDRGTILRYMTTTLERVGEGEDQPVYFTHWYFDSNATDAASAVEASGPLKIAPVFSQEPMVEGQGRIVSLVPITAGVLVALAIANLRVYVHSRRGYARK